jgi:hypothetical protein
LANAALLVFAVIINLTRRRKGRIGEERYRDGGIGEKERLILYLA